MSSTVTTTIASVSATPTANSCSNVYDIPTRDAACAMPFGGNHTDIMSECCGEANVISYYDDCGIYCLAVGQSVGDLTSCLFREGAARNQVWCGGEVNATATETGGGQAPSTASARVVATGSADAGGDDDDDDSNGGSGSGSGSGNGGTSNNDGDSAGVVVRPGLSVAGLTVGALLVSALAFGMQV